MSFNCKDHVKGKKDTNFKEMSSFNQKIIWREM